MGFSPGKNTSLDNLAKSVYLNICDLSRENGPYGNSLDKIRITGMKQAQADTAR